MTKLPIDIQIEFFRLLNDEILIEDFEQWVYSTKELEFFLAPNDYIELISLNFKSPHTIHEMKKIVSKYLDYGESEKRKINNILNNLINKDTDFAKSLIATYNLYCKGYGFLDNIGLGYGMTFADEFYEYKDWIKLSPEEKKQRIETIYDNVKTEAEKVYVWLEQEKVLLTGEMNNFGLLDYIDNRTTEEKKPTGYSVIRLDDNKNAPSDSIFPKKSRKEK